MAKQVQAKNVRHIQVCLSLLVFLLMLSWGALAQAQEECVGPEFSIIEDAWAQGSVVTVNISPDFTPGETWAIQDGISHWRNAGGSRVRFFFKQQETAIRGHNTIQVNREITPPDPNSNPPNYVPRASVERSFNIGQPLEWAVINIQPGLSIALEDLTNLASHETGHTFGLMNCSYCPAGTTAMGPGGGSYPSPCDQQAAKKGAGYQGTPPGVPGGPATPQGPLQRPDPSEPCWTRECVTTQICYKTERTREGGREVWCDPPELHCELVPGWCRTGAGEVEASESPCGQMTQADQCEFGFVCCFDHVLFPPITVPTCQSTGRYANEEKELCEAVSGAPCLRVFLQNSDCAPDTCPARTCWQGVAPGQPTQSCGAMGGDYCSPDAFCPAGYQSLGTSGDCAACCRRGPSCGALGGNYCSQGGAVPAGYENLGVTWDCNPCLKVSTCQSTGCPRGSCGWQKDNCGQNVYCGNCLETCGAMGGDYCSQSNSCPRGYESLGASSDCIACCTQGPSCGALGGNYCSQGGAVPAGYENLGATWDCNPCLRTAE